ncbi:MULTISPECIES: phage tail sheath subtilisin-like domain-containing protein [unclassified Paenibacillus]|jgi:phage tail sheath protein FI|uniref:phage tail sheath family protein n=1 Tax=unclassified Paenibacillus TaxID=185978 RepID=UPI00278086F5|nr:MULTISPECIES: phage tail sheath subtilisin-like domain-containing protein [unclassified Paenibacillus]MDQ0903662.1 phage tail sheath protein FI [Paenibacillus sp. V4I7]MDQ0917863.1 phage tail sheath protein FI [Paenibacillus sp. V4I5]
MADYLSPGVYVEEFDSGAQPLEGASTSTAGFIGLAQRGEIEGVPQLVTSVADFHRLFGSYLSENEFGEYRFLSYAVEHFYLNGGSRCYVMRVAPTDAKVATNKAATNKESAILEIASKNPGTWGNQVRIVVVPSSKAKTQIYEVLSETQYRVKNNAGFNVGDVVAFEAAGQKQYNKVVSSQDNIIELAEALDGDVVDSGLLPSKVLTTSEFTLHVFYGDEAETYEKVSLNISAANHIEKIVSRSNIITVKDLTDGKDLGAVAPFEVLSGENETVGKFQIALSGGSNGSIAQVTPDIFMGVDRGPGKRTGIQSFIDNDVVSIIAIPGVTEPTVQLSLVAHCENLGSRFAVLDIPREKTKVADVMTHRNIFDSSYAAMYNPWLQVFDPLDKRNIYIPPSGSVIGIYSRSDQTRGVQKAPANEVVRGAVGLDCQYNKGEQDILNPQGVNLIRAFAGQGIRVWGARTTSSNGLWKYVNVRRLFIFIEESIKNGTNWVVFEPNDEQLWARVQRTIDAFLTRVWRDGALMGGSPSEAFYINIGRSTMTQDDIDNGRLICVIGVAPVKPAEFVIFRITQKTREE